MSANIITHQDLSLKAPDFSLPFDSNNFSNMDGLNSLIFNSTSTASPQLHQQQRHPSNQDLSLKTPVNPTIVNSFSDASSALVSF
jgi:hypothetical protein